MFTLVLPGIGRARYCWLYIVIVLTFTSRSVGLCTHLSIDHRRISFFFRVFNFHGWPQPRNYFNSEIFPIYGIVPLSVFTATALGSPSPSQWISCALYTIPNSPIVEYSHSRQLKMYVTCAHNIITWKCRWKLEVLKFYVATCVFDCKNVGVYVCVCIHNDAGN